MSTPATRQITLTENPDGRWTAYDTASQTVTQGSTRDDALDSLDDALCDNTNGTETAPAAPLYDLIGLVDEEEGQRLKERSRTFREEVDERMERTRAVQSIRCFDDNSPLDRDTTQRAIAIQRTLRSRGEEIGAMDVLIAATAGRTW